jgi:hypothetical protein
MPAHAWLSPGTGKFDRIVCLVRRIDMPDKGSRDKAGKEKKKKPQHTLKEKKKLKKEKKNES